MKKLAILAVAAGSILTGCAVYDAPVYEGGGYHGNAPYYGPTYYSYPNRGPYYRDRDGDGVPNRYDSRPNNPYRN